MSSRLLKWIAVLVIGGGFGIWRATSKRSEASAEVQTLAMKIVQSLDCYSQHKNVLDQCAEAAHKVAFDQAYTGGSRRRSAKLDADIYLEAFLSALNHQFDLRNRPDLRKCVAETQARADKEAAEREKSAGEKSDEENSDKEADEKPSE